MESDYSQNRETTFALVAAALFVSVAAHLGLMYALSDCTLSTFSATARASQKKWTREVPTMRISTAAAPERPEIRETKLESDAVGHDAALEGLSQNDSLPPSAVDTGVLAEEAAPAPEGRLPKQEIIRVSAPVVPDDLAALPRTYVPDESRLKNAPELDTAALLQAPRVPVAATAAGKTMGGVGAGGGTEDAAGGLGGGADGVPGAPAVAPRAAPIAAAEVAAADTAAEVVDVASPVAETRAAPPKKAPPSVAAPAEMMARVDEAVVEKEKEAVQDLLGSQDGADFSDNVKTTLDWWADPDAGGRKYFRLTLSSDAVRPLNVVSKDLVFLLDASGSIANDRLNACRAVVKDALRALNTGDRFNVVAFRDKFDYCFSSWQPVTKDSLKKADKWMDRLTAHGRTDVFATLRSIMTVPRDPRRPVVALVVTDAEATAGMTKSTDILAAFTKLNGGLVSVYMYGVKERANKQLMDLLSRGNRGGWTYHAGDRKQAAAELNGFLETFHDPVLTDLRVMFASANGVEVHPKMVRNLYKGQPVEIWGSCPAEIKDLSFAVRGLNGADVFESVFRLPFAPTARTLDLTAKTEWAKLKSYDLQLGALR